MSQPRKRVDLWVFALSEWIKQYNRTDVHFHYHGATRDLGWNIAQLAHYYGVGDRLILTAEGLDPARGIPLDKMKYLYSSADLYFHACAVAGWEMPVMEAMACKVPCLVPDYSALSEWPKGAVEYVKINRRAPWHNPQMLNTTHYFFDVDDAIERLEFLYQNKERRDELADRGYKLVTGKQFQWKNIAQQFQNLLQSANVPIMGNLPVFPQSGVTAIPNAGVKVWEKRKQ